MWADLLTKYDGQTITYDNAGNPTKYYNGKTWNMEWSKGRELSRITRGSKTWDFTYDMAGVRSGKTVTTRDASTGEITGTTEYKYTTLSGKLVRVEYNTTVLDIVYDESGNPFSIRYKSNPTKEGVVYYYVLNVQGDVVGLLNSSGELVVEYKYDPWGKLLETKIGVDESNAKYDTYNNMALRNPLRYRGYIYDRDTGLYYLQSRYYDPAIGRFINADTYTTTDADGLLSTNMFAYCENNPISRFDPTGELFWDVLDWAMAAMSWDEFLNSPSWSGAGWALLDTLALLPGAPSLSYARRGADAINTLSHGSHVASGTKKAANVGWKVGDDISNLTKAGKTPQWSTVRQRYWKNEAFYRPGEYSLVELERMKKGKPPLAKYELNGKFYPMELHHPNGRAGNNLFDFVKLTPWDHDLLDPHRHFKP